jgi:dolichyl-diphosphooligosaccharide--protein glycosyltransferase
VTLFLLFTLFGSLGAVQVPVKTSQVTIEDGTYHSAQFVAERSDALGQTYPANYVYSQWGRNRVYNYFVNGESESYGYAQNTFEQFLGRADTDAQHDELDGQVGYVVLSTERSVESERATYSRLARNFGSRDGDVDGVGHYRALYLPPDKSTVVFSLVPGATITGTADPNATVSVATDVSLPANSPGARSAIPAAQTEFGYERQTTAAANGTYSVRVSQPGTYRIEVDGETNTVTVPASAVRNGSTVSM